MMNLAGLILLVLTFSAPSSMGHIVNSHHHTHHKMKMLDHKLGEAVKEVETCSAQLSKAVENLRTANGALLQCEESKSDCDSGIRNTIQLVDETFPPAQTLAFRKALAPGATLVVRGTPVKHDSDYDYECNIGYHDGRADFFYKPQRFYINLVSKSGDVALHFNPRFDEENTLANSYISCPTSVWWGREERWPRGPFEEDVNFTVEIKNTETAFEISVNGEFFNSFDHRVNNSQISGFRIGGDVEITGVQIV